jgi:crotonobetainyl-CoA:carnitine CoA-transferase CaiB-like acyl-CoA transferase
MAAGQTPLAGLKVVELARILAGPWIGQTLADLGADVVKVESPSGDDTRRWGPPYVKGSDGSDLDAAYFHCCNRGKRSVIADFKSEADLAFVNALIDRADVVIENFKTNGLVKYGLDYATVARRNPKIIYCSVTAFGQTGPYAERPGYDAMIQAMSGIMDLTGEPTGSPQKIGVAFADIFTGLYGVIAIQTALAKRARVGTGQHIDMALLDVMVSVLANQALNYFVSGSVPQRLGSAHPSIVPYQAFQVQDGAVMIAVGNDAQFKRLCEAIGEASFAEDARFSTNADRVKHRDALIALLSEKLADWPRDMLLSRLEGVGVPNGPVNTVGDVFKDPHVIHRQVRIDLADPGVAGGQIPSLRTPIRFSDADLTLVRPSPQLGAHTDELKRELGILPTTQSTGGTPT